MVAIPIRDATLLPLTTGTRGQGIGTRDKGQGTGYGIGDTGYGIRDTLIRRHKRGREPLKQDADFTACYRTNRPVTERSTSTCDSRRGRFRAVLSILADMQMQQV